MTIKVIGFVMGHMGWVILGVLASVRPGFAGRMTRSPFAGVETGCLLDLVACTGGCLPTRAAGFASSRLAGLGSC